MINASAFSIAKHAQSFLRAFAAMSGERARLVKEIDERASQSDVVAYAQLGFPAVVCLSFAAELGLKALLRHADIEFPKRHGQGHSLVALAALLPSSTTERLLLALKCGKDELQQYLCLVDRTFEDWRYCYEHESLSTHPDFLEQLAHFAIDEFYVVNDTGKVPRVGNW